MHSIQLLGGLSLRGPHGPDSRLPQRRPLAALATLAIARELGCSRPKLIGMLWPDDDESRARHHLSDALTSIRHTLGACAIHADGEMLYVNAGELGSDVAAFEDALAEGRLEDAVALYGGPLLDGFYVPGAGELDAWIGRTRDRLAAQYAGALERLAHEATAGGHHRSAAEWLRKLVSHDPYNTRVVLKLLAELEKAGDRPNALLFAEEHERRLRAELNVEPDAALLEALQRLRAPVPVPLNGSGVPPIRRVSPPSLVRPDVSAPTAPGRRRRFTRPQRNAAVSGGVTLLAVLLFVVLRGATTGLTNSTDHWAVVPFSTVGTDTTLVRLAGELPTIIEMVLPGPPGPHVHDLAGVGRRWKRAGGNPVEGLPQAEVLDIAQETGSGHVLLGTLARVGARIQVTLRLLTVPGGGHGGFEVGSTTPDSAVVLVEKLVNALLTQGTDPHAATAPLPLSTR